MDKFADMDLFVRIVNAGGLAAAGREKGLSPASVSARVHAMEKRYEARLLNRTTRSVSVTDVGQTFYETSIRILADVSEAEGKMHSASKELAGPLRISAPSDLGQQHVSPLLQKLVKKHRGIVPHLHLSDGIVNLQEHNIDIAIRYGEPPDSTLIAKHLAASRRMLCASPAYLRKNGTPRKPEDLPRHDCLTMVRVVEPLTTWYCRKNDNEVQVPINPTRSTNDGALIRRWAADGLGIALKSSIDIAEDINSKRLVRLMPDYAVGFQPSLSDKHNDLFLVYPSRQYVPERVRLFIDTLQQYFTKTESYSSSARK